MLRRLQSPRKFAYTNLRGPKGRGSLSNAMKLESFLSVKAVDMRAETCYNIVSNCIGYGIGYETKSSKNKTKPNKSNRSLKGVLRPLLSMHS